MIDVLGSPGLISRRRLVRLLLDCRQLIQCTHCIEVYYVQFNIQFYSLPLWNVVYFTLNRQIKNFFFEIWVCSFNGSNILIYVESWHSAAVNSWMTVDEGSARWRAIGEFYVQQTAIGSWWWRVILQYKIKAMIYSLVLLRQIDVYYIY